MEYKSSEQIEALETLKDYNIKIVKATKEVIEELRGDRKEDTDEYFNKIMEGINWEIQVLNRTMDIINESETNIEKDKINDIIVRLNKSIKLKDNNSKLQILEDELYPFLESLNQILERILA